MLLMIIDQNDKKFLKFKEKSSHLVLVMYVNRYTWYMSYFILINFLFFKSMLSKY